MLRNVQLEDLPISLQLMDFSFRHTIVQHALSLYNSHIIVYDLMVKNMEKIISPRLEMNLRRARSDSDSESPRRETERTSTSSKTT